MAAIDAVQAVEQFFGEWRSAGLILPNGWFGRPHDNRHDLTACSAAGDTLHVELDGQLRLTVMGAGVVAIRDERRLVIRGFATVAWDWHPYPHGDERHRVFSGGEVVFVAQAGIRDPVATVP